MFAAAAAWLCTLARPACGAPDPLSDMGAVRAYGMGVELMDRHRAGESLPYFRRALAVRSDVWQIHCDYAAALINAAGEARSGPGAKLGVVRSSWERAAMIHEALAEIDRAEGMAATPLDRAVVIGVRAQTLAVWGLGWNGLAEYRRARQLDPTSEVLSGRLDQLRRILLDPQWGQ